MEQSGKHMHDEDFWKKGPNGEIIRAHVKLRYQLFSPVGVENCPVDLRRLEVYRDTYQQGCAGERSYWVGTCAHRRTIFPWIGETVFLKRKSKMSVKLASCVVTVSRGSPLVQSTKKGGRADIITPRTSEVASLGEQGFTEGC